ncbi:MAG: DNA-processing protein DprA [Dehalococcoidia bacterium]
MLGKRGEDAPTLTAGQYKRLLSSLRDRGLQLAELLTPSAPEILKDIQWDVESERIQRLLDRGFLMSQAVERWRARAIWVIGHDDEGYPPRLLERLGDDAPCILYGCGEPSILNAGGLAVVGSRHTTDDLLNYSMEVGRLAAEAGACVISGAARGIDQAAMRGAIEARGRAAGVVADTLERASTIRENRDILMDGRLVLVSPYEPLAGFNVGNAMQRNKVVYALADAALVISAEYEKGGTWAGAVEQLGRLRLVPVYVRSGNGSEKGLESLKRKGALLWPDPLTADELAGVLAGDPSSEVAVGQMTMNLSMVREERSEYGDEADRND